MGDLLAGKYELLRKIAVGGMAEVFLASQRGVSGFEKQVVIKRILPHLLGDPELVRMFQDEARTAASLRHANVVDVYEVGEHEGTWFMAMEYLHGQSVRRIQEEGAARAFPIPTSAALQIVIDAARGLHYAHTRKDSAGVPLGIVHRDVSPHNLLVGYDGTTRILDFGIAKARSRTSRETVVGTIKGKLAYMSPEQVCGEPLDGRTDLFSLAIVLFELTTGRRLHHPDRLTFDTVLRNEIPEPRSLVPEYEPELQEIVLKALARNPANRFPDCAAFARALADFAVQARIPCSASHVTETMAGLFPEGERDMTPGRGVPPASIPVPISSLNPTLEAPLTPPAPVGPRSNLPSETGSFVGRVAALEAISRMFAAGARLVTLAGPGGSGKTRLAKRWGETNLFVFEGGAWLCDLGEARGIDAICGGVAEALGIRLLGNSAADSIAQIGRHLVERRPMLLILDNFEQVVEHGAASVARWMKEAPDVRFLVTSRELLKLSGEAHYEVGALELPVRGKAPEESEAVRLFVDRVKAIDPAFELDDKDVTVIGRIVQRLDGLPLSIELAASRMKSISPAKLLERLSQGIDLLSGSQPEARHENLRATIDWSWNLLTPREQRALAACAVFRGGFTLEAAEGVLEADSAAGALQALREKSLLRSSESPDGETRFQMYGSIREYAEERLVLSGEAGPARRRHAAWFATTCGEWAEGVDGLEGGRLLRKLGAEQENLIAACRNALAAAAAGSITGAATIAMQLLLALDPVLSRSGPYALYASLLDEALQANPELVQPGLRARILETRAALRRQQGNGAAGKEDLESALEIARATSDRRLEGRVLRHLALLSWDEGNVEVSRTQYGRALGLHRKALDRRAEGRTLGDLAGFDHEEGLLEDARSKYERALALLRGEGDRRNEGIILGYLGVLLQEQARWEDSRACYRKSIAACREAADLRSEGMFLGYLGTLLQEQGALDEARENYERALAVHRRIGDRWSQGFFLSFLAAVESGRGKIEAARLLFEAASEHLRSVGDPRLLVMLSLQRCHLELAEAKGSPAAGEVRASVETRLRAVEDDPGVASPRQSMDVRLALRLVRRAL